MHSDPNERASFANANVSLWNEFLEAIQSQFDDPKVRSTLAFIEIKGGDTVTVEARGGVGKPSHETIENLLNHISDEIGDGNTVSWSGDCLAVLLSDRSPGSAHGTLRRIGRHIATCRSGEEDLPLHLTPAIGYADGLTAVTAEQLVDMAQAALDGANSSLEIEPVRYDKKSKAGAALSSMEALLELWGRAPQPVALSFQLFLSLLLGLGGPFCLYAVCDALGYDISGAVYIGVVLVLVTTATTIWIEGFLALKPTAPPVTPGSPYPPATVIIPAYLPNEAETILETLHAFMRLEYQNIVQVIIAYNCPGPRLPVEDELDALAASGEYAGRFIIEPYRVEGSTSKAQNVNAAIGRVRGKFIGIFDADHHPLPDSLERAWRWLSNGWDIVQGRCSIRNGEESWVSRMVAIEFEQIYAVSHPGRARFHGFGIFGGSNGFWRTEVLHETRMRHSMLTEDIDSSIRAVERGYKIAGDRGLISEELAPTTLSQLLNQRLRWAQGWFQVSLQRVTPALLSRKVTLRQKLGLLHLLVWRELFPWYSIQVIPIMAYWVWVYGWNYIHWAVPIFVVTTIFTFSTGPGQLFFAYILARKSMRQHRRWFIEYFFVSNLFYAPFKDTLSRIAHLKEAMRERAWRVTARTSSPQRQVQVARTGLGALLVFFLSVGSGMAQTAEKAPSDFSLQQLRALIGGEASTITAARRAASAGRHAEAAKLFQQAIGEVPRRRSELLSEYADALTFSGRSAEAVPFYRERLASQTLTPEGKTQVLTHLALALSWSRQYASALKIYDDLTERSPHDVDLVLHRAGALSGLDRQDEALAELNLVPPGKWSSGPMGTLGDEILVSAARKAAVTNRNAASAELFERAIRHNPRLRPELLREYADQLLFTHHAQDAVPLYRSVVDGRLASGQYLSDAEFSYAEALAQIGKSTEAFQAYIVALIRSSAVEDPKTADALQRTSTRELVGAVLHSRSIAPGRLITAARLAVTAGEVTDADLLYKKAAIECLNCRGALIHEYADRLTFSSKPKDAVPIYREVLAQASPQSQAYRDAERGLSLALTWSGSPDEALGAWTAYLKTTPADLDAKIHLAQVLSTLNRNEQALQIYQAVYDHDPNNSAAKRGIIDETVNLARLAARRDQNAEASALFITAITLDPQRREALLREYADQLSFAGRSSDAVPLYQEALRDDDLTALDRRRAMTGLADAYIWQGRSKEALVVYDKLIEAYPDDVGLQWTRLVTMARQGAREDKNRDAAALFERAIKLDPNKRIAVLHEYADQLSYSGRSSDAILPYREVLLQPSLPLSEQWSVKKDLAQAYEWAGHFDEAKEALGELIDKYPDDPSWRWERLVVSARQAGKADRNKESADLFAEALQLMPARRPAILKEYADKLTFSKNAKAAEPLYRELIAKSKTPAENRSRRFDLAVALIWDNQLKGALQEYQALLLANPDDVNAGNGVARMLSWTGQQTAAKAAYQAVLARSPNNGEAMRGIAQVEDWQGHHRAAQAILVRHLGDDPHDVEGRRLLAQSYVWMGRPDKAMSEVRLALQQKKSYTDPPGQPRKPNVTARQVADAEAPRPTGSD